MQAKLLRVLQERELERVGGNRTIKVDVRVIATTNRDLQQSVEKKEFRQDLYFRLNVVPVHVPPLRERREDIAELAGEFMRRFARKHGVHVKGFTDAALKTLRQHDWPGNVRELQNVIERAVILCGENGMLEPEHLGMATAPTDNSPAGSSANFLTGYDGNGELLTLAEMEKRHILAAMNRCGGNRTHAAKLLDMSIRTLRNKLHEINGTSPKSEDEPETVEG